MRPSLLAFIFFALSLTANAEWKKIADGENTTYFSYEAGSISKTDQGVSVWFLYDFRSAQEIGNIQYKSVKILNEIDCSKRLVKHLKRYWYSDNMGRGSIIHSDTESISSWEAVVPDSVGASIWGIGKMACEAFEKDKPAVPGKKNQTANEGEIPSQKGSDVERSNARAEFSTGSGFFITQDGYFATNYHVIAEAKQISIRSYDGQVTPAELIKVDQRNDLAILKIQKRTSPIPIEDSSIVKRGSSLVAIGFPHIDIQGLEPKVTEGIVSSLKGFKDDPRFFQISAAVQSGNSGGPLLDSSGNLIGIVSTKLVADLILKETGDLTQNVNYAVKSNHLSVLAKSIAEVKVQLPKPYKKKLANTAEIFTSAEQSVGLVISKTGNDIAENRKAIHENSVPPGFVFQGNLIWAPIKSVTKSHDEAVRSCKAMVDMGFNDWRMPTARELQALQFSGELESNKNDWNLFITWSSTRRGNNEHFVVGLGKGDGDIAYSEDVSDMAYAISCVHFERANDFHQSVADIVERLNSGDISLSASKLKRSPAIPGSSLSNAEIDAIESTNVWWVQGNEFYLRVINVTGTALKDINFSLSSSPCGSSNKKIWISILFDKPLESRVEKVFHGALPFNYIKVLGEGTKCGLVEGANISAQSNKITN